MGHAASPLREITLGMQYGTVYAIL